MIIILTFLSSPEENKPNLKAKFYIVKFYYLEITNHYFC